MDETQQLNDLDTRVTALEHGTLGTDPNIHPLVAKNIKNFISTATAGVTQITHGTGISISPSGGTGNVTVTNAGVTATTAGTGIFLSSSTGSVTVGNSGVLQITAGSNITLTPSNGTGVVMISASGAPSGHPTTGWVAYGLSNASSTQTIVHSLGTTPGYIRFMGSANFGSAHGTWDGTTMNGVYGFSGTPNSAAGTSNYVLWLLDGTNGQEATISVSGTAIYLAWVKQGSGLSGELAFIWEAYI